MNSANANKNSLHWSRASEFLRYYVSLETPLAVALTATVLFASICTISAQYQMKRLVDNMAIGPTAERQVWLAFLTFIVLIAAESGLWRASAVLTCRFTLKLGVKMRLDLFSRLSSQPLRYFADNLSGALGQRITGTAGNFGAFINTVVWRMAPPVVDFIGAIVIFTFINWPMAVAMGLYVGTVSAALIVAGERGRALHSTYFGVAGAAAGNVVDVISNMWAVKMFSARYREWCRLKTQFDEEAASQRDSWMYTEKMRMVYDLVLWVMAAIMLCWSLRLWSENAISPGAVVVVSALTFRILHGARDFALALVDIAHQLGYIDDTLKVIAPATSVLDTANAIDTIPQLGCVEFSDVSFGYRPNELTLKNISLRIEHGEKVGIVGPSGAGKTSILHLIQRLYDTHEGEILVGGRPIASYTQESLRLGLSVVPQEIILFHRTIMENIRFGRADASDKDVLKAARDACCEEFILRLPDGFNTLVGERGVKLSGGQRQRVGIARALLKDAPVLLLDEATSALDTESEMRIQHNIAKLSSNRTVIAVAHRLSTLVSFDRILVISSGEIVEEGNPATLQQQGSIFQYLWNLQSQGSAAATESSLRD